MNTATQIVIVGIAALWLCNILGWRWLPGAFAIAFAFWMLLAPFLADSISIPNPMNFW